MSRIKVNCPDYTPTQAEKSRIKILKGNIEVKLERQRVGSENSVYVVKSKRKRRDTNRENKRKDREPPKVPSLSTPKTRIRNNPASRT